LRGQIVIYLCVLNAKAGKNITKCRGVLCGLRQGRGMAFDGSIRADPASARE
jgi:hypothetical protein